MGKKNRQNALARFPSGARSTSTRMNLPQAIVSVTQSGITVDLKELSVPERTYDADWGWIERRGGAVSFFFAKSDLNDPGKKLRSRLELRTSLEAFLTFSMQTSDFHKQIQIEAERSPLFFQNLEGNPAAMTADKDHSDWVSIVALTKAGTHGQADFFHLPQGDVVVFEKNNDFKRLAVQPVVRVYTTPGVLLRVADDAVRLAQEVGPLLPSKLETDE